MLHCLASAAAMSAAVAVASSPCTRGVLSTATSLTGALPPVRRETAPVLGPWLGTRRRSHPDLAQTWDAAQCIQPIQPVAALSTAAQRVADFVGWQEQHAAFDTRISDEAFPGRQIEIKPELGGENIRADGAGYKIGLGEGAGNGLLQ